MSVATTDIMSNLHTILKAISARQDKLQQGPRRVAAHQSRVDTATGQLESAQEELLAARMAADNKQLHLKSGETKIAELQTKLNTCSSNREYQALVEQIAADQMASSVLEDEILESLELVDRLEAEVTRVSQQADNTKAQLQDETARVEAEAGDLREEIAKLESDLIDAQQILPDEIRPDYERIVKARRDDSMASVKDGICEGCFQQILPNMIAHLALKETVICTSCGRLLYPLDPV